MAKSKGIYLKYNDDDPEIRELINVFRNRSRFYSEQDEEYNNNINMCMKNAELKTIDDCLEFFRIWFNIHYDVRKNWDEAIEP
jgi:hypothetical protein